MKTLAGITELLGLEWSGPEFPELTWGQWLFWFVVLTAFSTALSLTAMWWVISDLPNDYFVSDPKSARPRGFVAWLASNSLGLLVLAIGLVLLLSPGQGILLILCGVIMIDFPGKHRFERKVARRKKVMSGLNWFRRKIGKEPLLPPLPEDETEKGEVS